MFVDDAAKGVLVAAPSSLQGRLIGRCTGVGRGHRHQVRRAPAPSSRSALRGAAPWTASGARRAPPRFSTGRGAAICRDSAAGHGALGRRPGSGPGRARARPCRRSTSSAALRAAAPPVMTVRTGLRRWERMGRIVVTSSCRSTAGGLGRRGGLPPRRLSVRVRHRGGCSSRSRRPSHPRRCSSAA